MPTKGKMSYGYVSTLLEENRKCFDWLTRDIVNSVYIWTKKRRSEKSPVRDQLTINVIFIDQPTNGGNSYQISVLSDYQQLVTEQHCELSL